MRMDLMRTFQNWQRDLLLLVCRADEDLICHKDYLKRMKAIAGGLSYRKAVGNIETVETMNRQLEQNLPESLVLSFGLARLRSRAAAPGRMRVLQAPSSSASMSGMAAGRKPAKGNHVQGC
jgi:hypothetical protein